MSNDTDKKKRHEWWMQFVISVLGTAIGVGLTFAVSNRIDNNKKEQAQMLTAMMVIHDIDETIDKLKEMKETSETGYNITSYLVEHPEKVDSISFDTLNMVLGFLILSEESFRFDISKEKIFHSSPDTWQNLGSMKFIDNVQAFYFERQTYQELRNRSDMWREPIPMRDFEKISVNDNNMNVEEFVNTYYSLMRAFLKEKLDDSQVQYYISCSAWRVAQLVAIIDRWSTMNNENKFLMSITDEDLENYVNSIKQNGIPVKDKDLIGSWVSSSTDEISSKWEYRKDHTYTIVNSQTSPVKLPFARGKLKIDLEISGTWTLAGDSLIQNLDIQSFALHLNLNDMIVLPGRQQMFDEWVTQYEVEISELYKNVFEQNEGEAMQARLDASHNKMELKGEAINAMGLKEPSTTYLKRVL